MGFVERCAIRWVALGKLLPVIEPLVRPAARWLLRRIDQP